MNETIDVLIRYGYLVVFLGVLLEQLGLPLPAAPILLAAGAFAARGDLSLGLVLLLSFLAALAGDFSWYIIGRQNGAYVLQFLCRISLEPDSCVRRTENFFERHGARTLVMAKYVPGIATVAPPLAGMFRMRPSRFLLFDAAGAFIWVTPFVLLGYFLSDQLEPIVDFSGRVGALAGGLLVLGGVVYVLWKYLGRKRFIRKLRIARISPEELKRKLDQGEDVMVVDLRHALDFEAEPVTIPGALRMSPEELESRYQELAGDRDVILYCT